MPERNSFFKAHCLGNDYIAVDPDRLDFAMAPANIRALCDRHRGLGGDGVLALIPSARADFGVRIFNSDGSEAEKSGNGLRIFGLYLHAVGKTHKRTFTVETKGGVVSVTLHLDETGTGDAATVEMGRASFTPGSLPCSLDVDELVLQPIRVGSQELLFTGVSVGNPHCVVFKRRGQEWTRAELLEIGPRLERHPLFPNRVNVQLAVPTGPRSLDILIWERGVGETLASGTSACAAACAGVRLGVVEAPTTVSSPGGSCLVEVDADWDVVLSGPVREITRGLLSRDLVRTLA